MKLIPIILLCLCCSVGADSVGLGKVEISQEVIDSLSAKREVRFSYRSGTGDTLIYGVPFDSVRQIMRRDPQWGDSVLRYMIMLKEFQPIVDYMGQRWLRSFDSNGYNLDSVMIADYPKLADSVKGLNERIAQQRYWNIALNGVMSAAMVLFGIWYGRRTAKKVRE